MCCTCAHAHNRVFLRVNYTLVHGYLGGGNQGELVFGTRMSDADAVACMRFARRRSSRPRRRGVCIDNNIISAAAAADIILLYYRAYAQCVYKIKILNHFITTDALRRVRGGETATGRAILTPRALRRKRKPLHYCCCCCCCSIGLYSKTYNVVSTFYNGPTDLDLGVTSSEYNGHRAVYKSVYNSSGHVKIAVSVRLYNRSTLYYSHLPYGVYFLLYICCGGKGMAMTLKTTRIAFHVSIYQANFDTKT